MATTALVHAKFTVAHCARFGIYRCTVGCQLAISFVKYIIMHTSCTWYKTGSIKAATPLVHAKFTVAHCTRFSMYRCTVGFLYAIAFVKYIIMHTSCTWYKTGSIKAATPLVHTKFTVACCTSFWYMHMHHWVLMSYCICKVYYNTYLMYLV